MNRNLKTALGVILLAFVAAPMLAGCAGGPGWRHDGLHDNWRDHHDGNDWRDHDHDHDGDHH